MVEFTPTEEGTYESTTGELVRIDEKFFNESGRIINDYIKEGKVSKFESYMVRKDKKLVPLDQKANFLFNEKKERIGTVAILRDITERKQAEDELRKHRESLEDLVKERTAELETINKQLELEITDRKRAVELIIKRDQELEIKTINLEEINTALRVLLNSRDEDRGEFEERVVLNIKELIMPYIDKIKKIKLDSRQLDYVNILESNLNDIVSPFSRRLSSIHLKLTPTEIRVANLIKEGKTTKEIAEIMNLAKRTIDSYRENIRKKLSLKNRKTNLRTLLLTFE